MPGSEVAVIGGGMLGMTLALRLQAAGHRVTLFEGAAATGGLASPAEVGGYTWDRFYHVILLSDTALRSLLAELDLAERMRWGITRTGVYAGGKLYSVSNAVEFLRFPPLTLLDKIRLAATILRASRIRDGRPLEAVPVVDWLRRWSGTRTFERLWLPLLRAKLGENYREASAAFIWAIIARMYAARRSGLKQEMFGYVDGGYATVLTALRRRLADIGVEVRTGTPVSRVGGENGAAQVEAGGDTLSFDAAVLTVSCPGVLRLCPTLQTGERERLGRVVYQGVLCASLLLRRPLAGYYVTNITDDVPFTAVIEMTALVDRERFGGNALVYLPRYLAQEDDGWQRSDHDIREEFLAGLERMYPHFRREDVLGFQVARAREVLALATMHYTERSMPPLETSIPNVYIANSAQIANGTLNVNETVALAERQAAALIARLAATAGEPV